MENKSPMNGPDPSMSMMPAPTRPPETVQIGDGSRSRSTTPQSASSREQATPTRQVLVNAHDVASSGLGMRKGASASENEGGYGPIPDNPPVSPKRPKSRHLHSILREGRFNIFVGTWNMHGEDCTRRVAKQFLFPEGMPLPELYVIGTQECGRSIQKSVVVQSKRKWEDLIGSVLGTDFVMLKSVTLMAIHQCAFVRKDLLPVVSEIQTDYIATGIANVVGNKGAVALSFNVVNTSLLFICCHLPAHQSNKAARTAACHRINTGLKLVNKSETAAPPHKQLKVGLVDRFDRVWWYGDMNYRIDGNRSVVDSLLKQQMFEVMIANDQLLNERKLNRLLPSFLEGPLLFLPTYKYDPGTENFDTTSKCRIPAWTDRILYKSNEDHRIWSHWWNRIMHQNHNVHGHGQHGSETPIQTRWADPGNGKTPAPSHSYSHAHSHAHVDALVPRRLELDSEVGGEGEGEGGMEKKVDMDMDIRGVLAKHGASESAILPSDRTHSAEMADKMCDDEDECIEHAESDIDNGGDADDDDDTGFLAADELELPIPSDSDSDSEGEGDGEGEDAVEAERIGRLRRQFTARDLSRPTFEQASLPEHAGGMMPLKTPRPPTGGTVSDGEDEGEGDTRRPKVAADVDKDKEKKDESPRRLDVGRDQSGNLWPITLLAYDSCQEIQISDHRPVFAWFSVKFDVDDGDESAKMEEAAIDCSVM